MYHTGNGCQPKIFGASADSEGGCGGGWGVAGDGVERVQPAESALAGPKGAGVRDGAAAWVSRPGPDGAGLEASAGGGGRGTLREPSLLCFRGPCRGSVFAGGLCRHRGGGSRAFAPLRGAAGGAGSGGGGWRGGGRVRSLLHGRRRSAGERGARPPTADSDSG